MRGPEEGAENDGKVQKYRGKGGNLKMTEGVENATRQGDQGNQE